MKKIFVLILVIGVGLAAAGCGKKQESRLLGLWRITPDSDKVCKNLGLQKAATTFEFNKDGIVYADGTKMEYSIREGAYPVLTKEDCKKIKMVYKEKPDVLCFKYGKNISDCSEWNITWSAVTEQFTLSTYHPSNSESNPLDSYGLCVYEKVKFK